MFFFLPFGILRKLWLKSLPYIATDPNVLVDEPHSLVCFHLLWECPCITQVKTGCTKACLLMSKIDIQWVWKVTETTIPMIHTHNNLAPGLGEGFGSDFQNVSPCFKRWHTTLLQVSGTRTASSRSGTEARNRTAGAKSARPRIKSVFERCTKEPCISSLVDKCIDIYI